MAYLQLRFDIRRQHADVLGGVLERLGALSVSWEDGGDDACYEIAWPGEPHWRSVCLTGLFDADCQPDRIARQASNQLGEPLVPRVVALAEKDWERACLERFEPRRYGDDLWVCPSWSVPPVPHATNIVIDPGLAFGTGDHATTALCLEWIAQRDWSGARVMDYGCGSGILAIACLLKGAAHAVGVDVDPRAVSASTLNAERNAVAARFTACLPEDAATGEGFDLVVANILSKVLLQHRVFLSTITRPGAILLMTGILEHHAQRVQNAFAPDFDFEVRRRDGWCLLIGRKRAL